MSVLDRRGVRPTALVGLFLLVALAMIRPTRLDSFRDNLGDPALITWIMAWPGHALTTNPTDLFQSPLFWPHADTYAYSDVLLTHTGPYWLFYKLSGSWTVASIGVALLFAVVAQIGAYLLAHRLTGRRDAAIVAAVGFAFGAYGLGRMEKPQLATIGCFALAVVALLRFLERPSGGRAAVLVLANLATFYGALYYGALWFLLLGATSVATVAVRAVRRDPGLGRLLGWLAAAGAATAAGIAPTVIVLLRLQDDLERSRSLSTDYDLLRGDILRPADGSYVWRRLLDHPTPRALYEHRFFPGGIALALALVGGAWIVARVVRRRPPADADRPRATAELGIVLAMGAVGLALARGVSGFGPVSPWRFVHDSVPGFGGIRAVSRLAVPTLLAVAVLVAVGYAAIARRWLRSPRIAALALVVTVGATCLDLAAPGRWVPLDTSDATLAVYRELSRRAPGAVVELPMPAPTGESGWPFIESPRLLYSTLDWHPRVNGYSGFVPDSYGDDAQAYSSFPQPAAIERLRAERVRYVVLHIGTTNGFTGFSEEEATAILAGLPAGATSQRAGSAYLVDTAGAPPA